MVTSCLSLVTRLPSLLYTGPHDPFITCPELEGLFPHLGPGDCSLPPSHFLFVSVWVWLTLMCCCSQDWAKPGPYDQPMVNTLRRKKDKEPAALPDINGGVNDASQAMTLSQAPTTLQTSMSVEERSKALIPPLKVRIWHLILVHSGLSFIWPKWDMFHLHFVHLKWFCVQHCFRLVI